MNPYDQHGHRVRFDWGPTGADAVSAGASLLAVVDVLSFTTAVSVAVDAGVEVLPYRWRDDGAADHARRHHAVLAVGRSEAACGQVSLSAETIREAARGGGLRRLVLPSPNGSAIAHRLAGTGATVVAVCLRNAAATAAWAAARGDEIIGVVAAGERWPDGSLRPAVEDLWGAGAFIHALGGECSPEAVAAGAAWRAVGDVRAALGACASGRELVAAGFADDVAVAAERDASATVAVLVDDRFVGVDASNTSSGSAYY